jgi:hypothetical protein
MLSLLLWGLEGREWAGKGRVWGEEERSIGQPGRQGNGDAWARAELLAYRLRMRSSDEPGFGAQQPSQPASSFDTPQDFCPGACDRHARAGEEEY